MSQTPPTARVVILDVDGVVSPIGGTDSPWGDEVIAGDVSGPVLVSPTLCARLDALSRMVGVSCVWLTSWSADMRARVHPFPGKNWPVVPDPVDAFLIEGEWWKLAALEAWLESRREVSDVAWCDDHLLGDRSSAARRNLGSRGVRSLLLAPRTEIGLTPEHMDQLDEWAGAQPFE